MTTLTNPLSQVDLEQRPRCYLAGPISGVSWESAVSWRKVVSEELARHGVEAIDPLRHSEVLAGETKLRSVYPEWLWIQQRAIVHRSLYHVRRSQVVLANVLGARERSVGTITEIAVAHEYRIPVVLVVDEGNPHDHPFLKEMATVVTEDLNDAVEAVWRLFT